MRIETRSERLHPAFSSSHRSEGYRWYSVRHLDSSLFFERPHTLHHSVTVFLRHEDIADEHIGPLRILRVGQNRHGLDTGRDRRHFCSVLSQTINDQCARLLLIIHGKYSQTFNCRCLGNGIYAFGHYCGMLHLKVFIHNCKRKPDGEGRSKTYAFARSLNCATVEFDQMFDQCQAQTEAAVPARARRIGLAKTVEDMWEKFRRDALARIAEDNA